LKNLYNFLSLSISGIIIGFIYINIIEIISPLNYQNKIVKVKPHFINIDHLILNNKKSNKKKEIKVKKINIINNKEKITIIGIFINKRKSFILTSKNDIHYLGDEINNNKINEITINYAQIGNYKYYLNNKTILNKEEEKKINKVEISKVKKETLLNYIKNPKKIWKDIKIKELSRNEFTKKFKITYINKRSQIYKLTGLRKNDIIIKINNKVITSYRDIFKIYNNIESQKNITIHVNRNKSIKELNYEIN
jgi:type II secretory pathway component PulC